MMVYDANKYIYEYVRARFWVFTSPKSRSNKCLSILMVCATMFGAAMMSFEQQRVSDMWCACSEVFVFRRGRFEANRIWRGEFGLMEVCIFMFMTDVNLI